METYENLNIQEMPLGTPFFRARVEKFLSSNGLRMEDMDVYYTLETPDGAILAGGGLHQDIIKCVAVDHKARSGGLATPLVSRLLSRAAENGYTNVKVFTKPENQSIFASLGFRLLASAPQAVLMENGRGLEQYCAFLRTFRRPGRTGVVVMHANPFTKGHRYLLEQAAGQVDTLVVIPVREDLSVFPYPERVQMIRAGAPEGVLVAEGSSYQISALTFPTYFLKDLSGAAQTQMLLDLDLFVRHIAPALDASVRFVGTEPSDPLTARYNELMQNCFHVVEIPRLCHHGHREKSISATEVREYLASGNYPSAAALVPASSRPYLLASLADRALRRELETSLKPGLVGPGSNGAHPDMNFDLMLKGISSIHPFWGRMAACASAEELRTLGVDAERAMLEATGGVNTHRGAIFAMGLALHAAGQTARAHRMETPLTEEIMQNRLGEIARGIFDKQFKNSELHLADAPLSHGREVVGQFGVKGAREMALEGYRNLFCDWLPYYRSVKDTPDGLRKTLLRIMSSLDDTCILHRVGFERAQEVKREAARVLENFSEERLKELCDRYISEGISPGGAADMLALTLFIHTTIW